MKMCQTLLQATEKRGSDRNPFKQLIRRRLTIIMRNLKHHQFRLLYIICREVNIALKPMWPNMDKRIKLREVNRFDFFADSEIVWCGGWWWRWPSTAFGQGLQRICYCERSNSLGEMKMIGSRDAQMCSNLFASILLPPARIDIKHILQASNDCHRCFGHFDYKFHCIFQMISKGRSERCCMALISSLLATCKMESSMSTTNSESDTSSIEILKTLTSHISTVNVDDATAHDPAMSFFDKMVLVRNNSMANDAKSSTVNEGYLDRLVAGEQNYFALILLKCCRTCPSVFGEKSSNYVNFILIFSSLQKAHRQKKIS